MYRPLLALAAVIAFLYCPFLLQRATLGFHPAKLHPRIPFQPDWETHAAGGDEIVQALDQPYSYFALGSQSYVFSSRDGKYVLKLFRYNRSQFPLIQTVKKWFRRGKAKADFFTKFDKTFRAAAMASERAPECTQILFAHLNQKKGHLPAVEVSDPIGRKWVLPLNGVRFLLQRKGSPFKATLQEAAKNREEMEKRLQSFVDLLLERTGKGIRNSDPNFGPNFGFFEGKAIEIDCGNYRNCPELADPERRIQEMHRFCVQVYAWLLNNAPEYAHAFHCMFDSAYRKLRGGAEPSQEGEYSSSRR